MLYAVLKTLHIAAIVVWLAAMLAAPLIAVALRQRTGDRSEAFLRLRRFHMGVGTPAMLATLALGFAMAQQAGWFAAVWLQIKLALVLALAALHGAVARQLRCVAADPGHRPRAWLEIVPVVAIALFVVTALLAVAKPGG